MVPIRWLLFGDTHVGLDDPTRLRVQDYTFRPGRDVIRGCDLPAGVAAVLSGHIHRAQGLRADLRGEPLPAPVVHSGATERTSFAERGEPEGYRLVDLEPDGRGVGRLVAARFFPLATRPMVDLEVLTAARSRAALADEVERRLRALPVDAIVRVRAAEGRDVPVLSAPTLRALAPPTMSLDCRWRPA